MSKIPVRTSHYQTQTNVIKIPPQRIQTMSHFKTIAPQFMEAVFVFFPTPKFSLKKFKFLNKYTFKIRQNKVQEFV